MNTKKFAIVCLALILLSSCNSSGKLTRRYKKIAFFNLEECVNCKGQKDSVNWQNDVDKYKEDYVDINAYFVEKEKVKVQPKTIFDLSPKGQSQLIQALSRQDSSSSSLISSLSSPLQPDKKVTNFEILDYTKIDKRFIVSIRNNSYWPANRIAKIKINLEIIPDSTLVFSGCDKLATEFESIDLGKLNYSRNNSFEVSGNGSIGNNSELTTTGSNSSKTIGSNAGLGIDGTASTNNTFSEEVALKQRYVVLNAALDEKNLSLYQESISGIDLTGNIIADVSLQAKNIKALTTHSFSGIFKKNDLNDAGSLIVSEKVIMMPNFDSDTVLLKLSYKTDFREVRIRRFFKGHKTISESDDKVNIYRWNVDTAQIVLLPINDIKPKIWSLSSKDGSQTVRIENPASSDKGDLLFSSYKDAQEFLFWLKNVSLLHPETFVIGKFKHIISIPNKGNLDNILIMPH